MRQKYIDHIESIIDRKRQGEVNLDNEWHRKAPLFQMCTRSEFNMNIGCPTMIRISKDYTSDYGLTETIREDEKIPKSIYQLEELVNEKSEEEVRDILGRFAYYQNLIDDLSGIPQ